MKNGRPDSGLCCEGQEKGCDLHGIAVRRFQVDREWIPDEELGDRDDDPPDDDVCTLTEGALKKHERLPNTRQHDALCLSCHIA